MHGNPVYTPVILVYLTSVFKYEFFFIEPMDWDVSVRTENCIGVDEMFRLRLHFL